MDWFEIASLCLIVLAVTLMIILVVKSKNKKDEDMVCCGATDVGNCDVIDTQSDCTDQNNCSWTTKKKCSSSREDYMTTMRGSTGNFIKAYPPVNPKRSVLGSKDQCTGELLTGLGLPFCKYPDGTFAAIGDVSPRGRY